jgi:hypothetical protein
MEMNRSPRASLAMAKRSSVVARHHHPQLAAAEQRCQSTAHVEHQLLLDQAANAPCPFVLTTVPGIDDHGVELLGHAVRRGSWAGERQRDGVHACDHGREPGLAHAPTPRTPT